MKEKTCVWNIYFLISNTHLFKLICICSTTAWWWWWWWWWWCVCVCVCVCVWGGGGSIRIEPFSDIALFLSFPHIYTATTWTNVYMIAAHHGTLVWFHPSSLLVKATYIIDSFTGCVMWLSVAFEKQWKFPPVTWAENLLQPRHSQPIFRPANHKRVCQPIGVDVLLYRTEGPSAPRLGLCSSLIFGWTAAN